MFLLVVVVVGWFFFFFFFWFCFVLNNHCVHSEPSQHAPSLAPVNLVQHVQATWKEGAVQLLTLTELKSLLSLVICLAETRSVPQLHFACCWADKQLI